MRDTIQKILDVAYDLGQFPYLVETVDECLKTHFRQFVKEKKRIRRRPTN